MLAEWLVLDKNGIWITMEGKAKWLYDRVKLKTKKFWENEIWVLKRGSFQRWVLNLWELVKLKSENWGGWISNTTTVDSVFYHSGLPWWLFYVCVCFFLNIYIYFLFSLVFSTSILLAALVATCLQALRLLFWDINLHWGPLESLFVPLISLFSISSNGCDG